mmetsp:Transcript_107088/g.185284  ORF Transcript_107088/g.185284 Transcript_107088/m.185284 type:complete len:260 (-) Transcript_107088:1369-2148(-)
MKHRRRATNPTCAERALPGSNEQHGGAVEFIDSYGQGMQCFTVVAACVRHLQLALTARCYVEDRGRLACSHYIVVTSAAKCCPALYTHVFKLVDGNQHRITSESARLQLTITAHHWLKSVWSKACGTPGCAKTTMPQHGTQQQFLTWRRAYMCIHMRGWLAILSAFKARRQQPFVLAKKRCWHCSVSRDAHCGARGAMLQSCTLCTGLCFRVLYAILLHMCNKVIGRLAIRVAAAQQECAVVLPARCAWLTGSAWKARQ